MQTNDVREGTCGCGACVATYCAKRQGYVWMFTAKSYVQDGETICEPIRVEVRRCPHANCRYDLGEDGKARRMMDATRREVLGIYGEYHAKHRIGQKQEPAYWAIHALYCVLVDNEQRETHLDLLHELAIAEKGERECAPGVAAGDD